MYHEYEVGLRVVGWGQKIFFSFKIIGYIKKMSSRY